MNVWPDFQIDVNDEMARKHRYEVHALARVSDGTHFDVVRRGDVLRTELTLAVGELTRDVDTYLDRAKLPTTPGAVIRSLESNARYVRDVEGIWHGNGGMWTDEYLFEAHIRFEVVAS